MFSLGDLYHVNKELDGGTSMLKQMGMIYKQSKPEIMPC